MPPDARLAAAPRRVNPDAFQQFFAGQMFHNGDKLTEPSVFATSALIRSRDAVAPLVLKVALVS